jgi:hypothetical protein
MAGAMSSNQSTKSYSVMTHLNIDIQEITLVFSLQENNL